MFSLQPPRHISTLPKADDRKGLINACFPEVRGLGVPSVYQAHDTYVDRAGRIVGRIYQLENGGRPISLVLGATSVSYR